ncbi:MAG: hypothetical protein NDJ89_03465 [Oligoflexia bacterium]|nr:hypothetical protein [Oligoflexia bacterium]
MRNFKLVAGRTVFAGLIAIVAGCAQAPVRVALEPEVLLREACGPNRDIRSVKGSVWLKVSSKEVSGQFPASVEATAPDALVMEVTNLVGGREALITVSGKRYTIEVPNRRDKSQSGARSWGGIPLEWATELFLGRLPCPGPEALGESAVRLAEAGVLEVDVPANLSREAQRFVYRFAGRSGDRAGRPVVESLRWERKSPPVLNVDFTFGDPDDSGSPRKWEARSSQGEIKVRWRERELSR